LVGGRKLVIGDWVRGAIVEMTKRKRWANGRLVDGIESRAFYCSQKRKGGRLGAMEKVRQVENALPSATKNESDEIDAFGRLSQQQVSIYHLLKGFAVEDRFHDWYYGAIRALELKSPDYLAQAAHSIRELCDRLPASIARIPQFDSPLAPFKALESEFANVKSNGYKDG